MRVLLTGGYGCIGSWIVRNLLARGDQVCIYDLEAVPHRLRLLVTAQDLERIAFALGDVTDLDRLRSVLETQQTTHVIHLAGLQVPTCRANPLLGAKVNVLGTLTVLEAVRLAGPAIQRLVYASSAAVYGSAGSYMPGPIDDEAPLAPATHYGVFKQCNEGNARVYYQEHGLSSIGLRPWTVYGVGRDFGMTSEPTKAIQALARGQPYAISYGGIQDLQYADDVARTFVRCLEAPYEGARSFNLRGHVVDLPTFHRALVSVDARASELITYGDRQLDIIYDLDDAVLQRELGPMPRTPLLEGVRQTYELFQRLERAQA